MDKVIINVGRTCETCKFKQYNGLSVYCLLFTERDMNDSIKICDSNKQKSERM